MENQNKEGFMRPGMTAADAKQPGEQAGTGKANAEVLGAGDIEGLDAGIAKVVSILNQHGFRTFESCQGGEGHFFLVPTVRFEGNDFDLIRAYELCTLYKINVTEAKRVYKKTPIYGEVDRGLIIGEGWDSAFNELTFALREETGTIYLS
jgi:hypothetical protein